MIITTPFKFEIGRIYTERDLKVPFEMYGVYHYEYRFIVLRQTTHEEFRKYLEKTYSDPENIEDRNFFYEISMD